MKYNSLCNIFSCLLDEGEQKKSVPSKYTLSPEDQVFFSIYVSLVRSSKRSLGFTLIIVSPHSNCTKTITESGDRNENQKTLKPIHFLETKYIFAPTVLISRFNSVKIEKIQKKKILKISKLCIY